MSPRTTKTNPAYAALAYRKSILHHIIYKLQRDCVGENNVPPKETIVSEDVFSIDGDVPIEEITLFVEQLVDQKEAIELEMAKFEFARKKKVDEQAATTTPNQGQAASSTKGSRKAGSKASGQS